MSFISSVHTNGLMDAVSRAQPVPGGFALFWLGQAGFLVKTHEGHLIGIDPCLSDYCQRVTGLKRLIPAVCAPEAFACDTLFVSHEHEDHFDADLICAMNETRRYDRLLGPVSIQPLIEQYRLDRRFTRLEYGGGIALPGVTVTPVFSDHGPKTPNAMGFIFDFGALRLYYAGDTAFSPPLLSAAFEARPDIAIMPINGEFGNLDAVQAYALAGQLECRALVPCHYWMYARHGGNPLQLMQLAQQRPGPAVVWLALGEGWLVGPEDSLDI